MNVIDFASAKADREPHWQGKAVCLGCRHEWQAVGPMRVYADLNCPSCGLPKGVVKNLFGCNEGDLEFRCICGCEALTAYQHKGRIIVRCMACGEDQTNAVWGAA